MEEVIAKMHALRAECVAAGLQCVFAVTDGAVRGEDKIEVHTAAYAENSSVLGCMLLAGSRVEF